MSTNNKFIKSMMLHIKYPYTALVISVMWIGMAIIIARQPEHLEILIGATSVCTLIVAGIGFKSPR